MDVRRYAEREPQAWRNGRGTTRELVAEPAGAWAWRISIAEVAADDDFSAFPGVDRHLMVVEGDGLVLTVDGVEHVLAAPHVVLRFDGGARTTCRLRGGPLRDLNLMTRRDAVHGELVTRRLAAGEQLGLAGPGAAILLEGAAAVDGVPLGHLDAAVLAAGEVASCTTGEHGAIVAVARVTPRGDA